LFTRKGTRITSTVSRGEIGSRLKHGNKRNLGKTEKTVHLNLSGEKTAPYPGLIFFLTETRKYKTSHPKERPKTVKKRAKDRRDRSSISRRKRRERDYAARF
jgi:hypothetical protein